MTNLKKLAMLQLTIGIREICLGKMFVLMAISSSIAVNVVEAQ
jgi:hypothetical protein